MTSEASSDSRIAVNAEVEAAYRWWVDAGSPSAERWRFAVSPQGQRVELE